MSKRKKSPTRKPVSTPMRRTSSIPQAVLDRIHDRMEQNELEPMQKELLSLEKQEPYDERVLALLINVSSSLGDSTTLERAAVKYCRQEPNIPEAQLLLAQAYAANSRPALALKAFERVVERWPEHPDTPKARENIEQLRPILTEMLDGIGLKSEDRFEIASLHEEAQSVMALGESAKARSIANTILKTHPTFAPAHNNVAYSFAYEGNYRDAIAASLRVLEFEPENVHALANLVRYYSFTGDHERAQTLAQRLKDSRAPAYLPVRKTMETLFFVSDFAGILETYERAQQDADKESNDPALVHLAAAAACFLGQTDTARRLWQQVLNETPDNSLAEENLEDMDLPDGERHGPFAFRAAVWLDGRLMESLTSLAHQVTTVSEEAVQRTYRKFIRQHPEIVPIADLIFEQGDPNTVRLILSLARASGAPEFAEPMRKFAMGRRGSDELRLLALNATTQPGSPSQLPIPFWSHGQKTEIAQRGYEIYTGSGPDTVGSPDMSSQVYELYEAAINLYHDGEFHQSEVLINRALTLDPDNPTLRNNLAALMGAQGRHAEADAQIEEIHARNPDYFFGRCNLATVRAYAGRLDEAKALLEPIETITRLHITEFTALCTAEITYCLAKGELKAAEVWGDMLKQVDPKHRGLSQLERPRQLQEIEEELRRLDKRR